MANYLCLSRAHGFQKSIRIIHGSRLHLAARVELQTTHELPTRKKIAGIERWKIPYPKKLHRRKIPKAGKFSWRPSYSGIWQAVSFTNRLSNKSGFILM
jgi:hypothetical protein